MDEEIKKEPTKRVLLRNDENFWRYLEQRIAELSKAVKERAANTDQQITNAGEGILSNIPEQLKYDKANHKTRQTLIAPTHSSRFLLEQKGGFI